MRHTTTIDTIGIQLDLNDECQQREILDGLFSFIIGTNSFYVEYKDYHVGISTIRREHFIYANNNTIATINTGVFRAGSAVKNDFSMKYYISIKFAGLKSYNEVLDASSYNFLLMICAYLNKRGIAFKLTELDICIDVECEFEHMLAICTKKSPKTQYYGLDESQIYDTTSYIEKITKKKLNKAVLRAYTYDKSFKEGLDSSITRFEVKLQAKYFNKYGFSIASMAKALDRYYVMYFEDMEEKDSKIEAYNGYQTVRKREISRLGLDNYRLHADIGCIEHFIYTIQSVGTMYDYTQSDINTTTQNNSYIQ